MKDDLYYRLGSEDYIFKNLNLISKDIDNIDLIDLNEKDKNLLYINLPIEDFEKNLTEMEYEKKFLERLLRLYGIGITEDGYVITQKRGAELLYAYAQDKNNINAKLAVTAYCLNVAKALLERINLAIISSKEGMKIPSILINDIDRFVETLMSLGQKEDLSKMIASISNEKVKRLVSVIYVQNEEILAQREETPKENQKIYLNPTC